MATKKNKDLLELLALPIATELAGRRGVHGVTKENIAIFVKNYKKIIAGLRDSKGLQNNVVMDLADAIDNIASDVVDAIVKVFAANTPGGAESDDT